MVVPTPGDALNETKHGASDPPNVPQGRQNGSNDDSEISSFNTQSVAKLKRMIERFSDYHFSVANRYKRLGTLIVIVALLTSLGASVAGFWEYPKLAGTLSLFIAFYIGLERAFDFQTVSELHRSAATRATNLRDHLTFRVTNNEEFFNVYSTYLELRVVSQSYCWVLNLGIS
jgi:hypothetical protein